MKMFVVLALVAAVVAEPEAKADAEADPALIYGSYAAAPLATTYAASNVVAPVANAYHVASPFVRTAASPLTAYNHLTSPVVRTVASPLTTYSHVASPVVRTIASPLTTYGHVASPLLRTVASPFVSALASHTVTSYNSPSHYTAVSNGVYGPSYVAKNGAVQHVVKREAEAEAEADPALVHNTVPTYSTSNVVAPLASTYAVASPLTTTYNHVASPLTTTYNHVASPLTTAYSHVASPLTTAYRQVVSPYNVAALPLTTYSASPLVRHFIGKREAEAEADPALIYGSYAAAPLAATYATSNVVAPFANAYHVASPVVRTLASPLTTYGHVASPLTTYGHVASPLTTYGHVASPVTTYGHVASPVLRTVASPFVRALASHTVTSYNSPNHYTAVSNGVYGPSYVAKNGAVQHVVKREAEAEADPALVYNTVPTYSTSNVVAPLTSTYAVASPLTTTYNHVASPLTTTYNHVASPLTTTYNHVAFPLTTAYSHVASPLTTAYRQVASPYNVAAHVVASPITYTNVATPVFAATALASNGAHAVAATNMGWTHSSNVGVCTNVHGQQVSC